MESIFFNRGNEVASDVDVKSLYRIAQIQKDQFGLDKTYVIVQNKEEETLYVLFDEDVFNQLDETKKGQYIRIDSV
ncbi:MAG: hypothetical protein ACK5NA_00520 [Enterococcus sp.]